MNLRKIFNIPSKNQLLIIEKQYNELNLLADKKSNKDYNIEKEWEEIHNSTCPNCIGKNIVNKIADVHGSGEISGSFSFGSGSFYGSSSINTSSVNNCNNCGNQWKKYEINYYSKSKIIGHWINDICRAFEKRELYNEDKIKFLKEYYAESIWKLYQDNDYNCYHSTRDLISLILLRIKFNSIYDFEK